MSRRKEAVGAVDLRGDLRTGERTYNAITGQIGNLIYPVI